MIKKILLRKETNTCTKPTKTAILYKENEKVNQNAERLNQIKRKPSRYLVGNVNGIIRNGGERNIKPPNWARRQSFDERQEIKTARASLKS